MSTADRIVIGLTCLVGFCGITAVIFYAEKDRRARNRAIVTNIRKRGPK